MTETPAAPAVALRRTPLHGLHQALGARFVAFAGYEMPVQYAKGIIAEHLHTRAEASLFDVSHMGQVRIEGDGPGAALEALVVGDIQALGPWAMRYTLFTNPQGGILDDLIVTRVNDRLHVVVNAARREVDLAHLRERLSRNRVTFLDDRALIALQGPAAEAVIGRHAPSLPALSFLHAREASIAGAEVLVSRSGYTGEDGFEISCAAGDAERIAQALLDEPEVEPAGLGARDTLRLEAGLCLYGQDIDETTTPVEAGLSWTIGKRRRAEGGFPGAEVILRQLAQGPERKRVGIRPDGRAPARAHAEIRDRGGQPVGEVTSGGFGPSVGGPVAMGYVKAALAAPGTPLALVVRNTARPARVVRLPFVAHRYRRG